MRRHRFEPAALMMGLALLGVMTAFVLDACGVWDLSQPRRSVPVAASALLLATVTAMVTQIVRSVRRRMRQGRR